MTKKTETLLPGTQYQQGNITYIVVPLDESGVDNFPTCREIYATSFGATLAKYADQGFVYHGEHMHKVGWSEERFLVFYRLPQDICS